MRAEWALRWQRQQAASLVRWAAHQAAHQSQTAQGVSDSVQHGRQQAPRGKLRLAGRCDACIGAVIAKGGSAAASSASVIAMITTREMCARGHPGRSNCWRHFHHRACLSSVRKRVQRARRQRITPVPEWYRWPPPTPPGVLNTALPSPLSGCCCCGAAARGNCARHCSSGSLPLSAQLTYAAEGCLLADILGRAYLGCFCSPYSQPGCCCVINVYDLQIFSTRWQMTENAHTFLQAWPTTQRMNHNQPNTSSIRGRLHHPKPTRAMLQPYRARGQCE